MITYAADSHIRYGFLAFYPAADHAPGTARNQNVAISFRLNVLGVM